MQKILTIILAAFLAQACLCSGQTCGNDCQGGPEKCGCSGGSGDNADSNSDGDSGSGSSCCNNDDSSSDDGGANSDQGANPFAPYSGSVHRTISDLKLFGGIGQYKLEFKRISTSRYKPAIPTPLGTGGSWRHSYYWNIVPNGTDASTGNEIIHIDYPNGAEYDFHKTTSSDLYLTAVSGTQERIEQTATDLNQYYLWFPDGHRVAFYKQINGNTTTFKQQGFYDKYNNFYAFTWDPVRQRVTDITEPGGRYIHLTYGYIGNFNQVNTTFVYSNSSATSVTVLGDFNNWGNPSGNPMVKGSDGVWRATVTLQQQTSYQYKFLVNGSTWISDPSNPNTFPAGGPSSGNNSVVTVRNADSNTTAASSPVIFSYTSSTATSVAVAGSFNGWSMNANPLTRSGNTWTATISVPNGVYDYKFVINNSTWQQDSNDPYTDPDGYGGYNSRLAVGPYDDAITQVASSDGRSVTYSYSMYGVGGTLYSTLNKVTYGDQINGANTQAVYTYNAPSIGSRPTLAVADDPHYVGPMTKVAYTYQNNNIEGFIATEASPVDGTIVANLAPSTTGDRSVTIGGRTIQSTFAQGNLASRTDSLGRTTSYTYYNGGWGMLSGMSDPNGNTTSYGRTLQFGKITSVTYSDSTGNTTGTRSVVYSDNNKPFFPHTKTDENGHTLTYTRNDPNNRPTRIDYPDGSYETLTYGGTTDSSFVSSSDNTTVTLLSSHRLRTGYTESFTYYMAGDPNGQQGDVKTKTNAAGGTTTYTYDSAGRIFTMTDGLGNLTSYTYNDRGQIIGITYAASSTKTFGYDAYGNQTSVTTPNALGTTSTWHKSYDPYNRVMDSSDPLGNNTHYEYGDPVSGGSSGCSCNIQANPTSITLPSGKTTNICYDTEWQKTSVTVGSGSDAATTNYAYDNNGNLTNVTDPKRGLWRYDFDSRNRKTKVTDPNGNYTSWTYDGVGNKKTQQRFDQNNIPVDTNPINYSYDGSNHLTDVTDQAGNHTHMSYDGAGNMLTLQDPHNDTSHLYTFTYDGMNRKLTMVYPDSTSDKEQWHYDAAGNLQTYTTRAGQIETFGYDGCNRETSASWSDGTAGTTKSYFANGLLKTLNSPVSNLTYAYDAANRVTSETQQLSASSGSKTVSYGYDADSNRTSITYPSGSSVSLDYTGRNQVKTIASGSISALYAYDANGNPQAKTLGNGTSANYTYDPANRLLTLDNQISGASFARYDYAYNALNDRTSRTETIGAVAKLDAYGYDPIDQLTQVKYNYSASTNTQDRLVAYNYDAAGNRSGPNGITDSVSGNTNYGTPNSLNQYGSGSLGLPYDTDGNLSGQNGWTYAYDALNRMTSASNTATNIIFAYDGRNRCVSRSINGTITFFYYERWNLIEERNSAGSLLARYVHGGNVDELIAAVTSIATTYYHHDALGSTVALTDTTGNLVEHYTYDVLGSPTILNSSNTNIGVSAFGNRFLFTGREYLQQASLYDYRNRLYSAQFGRFLQTDRMRFAAGDVNLYRYVANNIADYTDPLGLTSPCKKDCPPSPPSGDPNWTRDTTDSSIVGVITRNVTHPGQDCYRENVATNSRHCCYNNDKNPTDDSMKEDHNPNFPGQLLPHIWEAIHFYDQRCPLCMHDD